MPEKKEQTLIQKLERLRELLDVYDQVGDVSVEEKERYDFLCELLDDISYVKPEDYFEANYMPVSELNKLCDEFGMSHP